MTSNKIVTYVDEDKNTDLHYAAVHCDLEKIKEELESNHEIDPVNYLGWTPLMMATRYGHTDIIKLLLERHADSTRVNSFGYNILLMAVASGKLEIICLILQHLLCGGISRQSMESVFSPISLAILFNNANVVQHLIDKEFSVDAVAPITEISPIMLANTMCNTEIINLLRAKGATETKTEPPSIAQSKPHHYVNVPHPLILLNSAHMSPQPTFICMPPPNVHMPRRCSDLTSPYTPNISPMPQGVVLHQVFFPQNFSPNQYLSPVNTVPFYNTASECLNSRMMQNGAYLTPTFNSAY